MGDKAKKRKSSQPGKSKKSRAGSIDTDMVSVADSEASGFK